MIIQKRLSCFKAYDVRGKLGEELNDDIAYRIGRATVQTLDADSVVVGFDARETSSSLAQAVSRGICDSGANVMNIGLAGTEEVYSAVSAFNTGAGIEITASHNPIDYNGMKIVKSGSEPLSESEFSYLRVLSEEDNFKLTSNSRGTVISQKHIARDIYLDKILSFIDLDALKPLKILINFGNGAAGPVVDLLNVKLKEKGVSTDFVFLHQDPDPSFPNGIPNPLLEENRYLTSSAVIREKSKFGVAFDGDFDRCFFFDHLGNFIPGEYLVGLLAENFLKKEKGATVIHDPRVIWNTIDVVSRCGGQAVTSKTGHAFIKSSMRRAGAIYGGEMSAHHYFRDFAYCDSGMIPWLLVWEILSKNDVLLADLISERRARFPSSGEINFTVLDATKCLQSIKNKYDKIAMSTDEMDGLSMSFENWRFSLRKSNTEPLVRLNVETKGDELLLKEITDELISIIVRE